MRLALLLVAGLSLSACRFWYKPVPVANPIGEETVALGADTLNVYREPRFEVYGPNPEAVYDGYEQLNRAYRAFERHFGAPAPRLAVILMRDTAETVDSAAVKALQSRGFSVINYLRPRGLRSRARYGGIDYGGVMWPIAPAAARRLLEKFAERHLDERPAAGRTVLDRFPMWYRAAVMRLVGEAGAASNDVAFLREKRTGLMRLRELMTLVRPASADSTLDPARPIEADEPTRLLAAQSATVARYFVEREGPEVLGRIALAYIESRTLPQILGMMESVPDAVPDLERSWRSWLETREH